MYDQRPTTEPDGQQSRRRSELNDKQREKQANTNPGGVAYWAQYATGGRLEESNFWGGPKSCFLDRPACLLPGIPGRCRRCSSAKGGTPFVPAAEPPGWHSAQ